MEIIDASERLQSARVGSSALDRMVFEALGWTYYPSARRGMRTFPERWVRGYESFNSLPPVTVNLGEAEKYLFTENIIGIRMSYDLTVDVYMILDEENDIEVTANTRALLMCAYAITKHGKVTGVL